MKPIMIEYVCPFCKTMLEIDETFGGTEVTCSCCGKRHTVPLVSPSLGRKKTYSPPPHSQPPSENKSVNYQMVTVGLMGMALGFCVGLYFMCLFEIASRGSDVVNLGLLNQRTNGIIVGAVFYISGSILLAVGAKK